MTLHVGLGLQDVYEQIQAYHPRSWLTPRYFQTLQSLNRHAGTLYVIAVTLRQNGIPHAGEIGYILGSTYTSLTGFSSRDPHFRNYGTAQIVLLAQWLKRHGEKYSTTLQENVIISSNLLRYSCVFEKALAECKEGRGWKMRARKE